MKIILPKKIEKKLYKVIYDSKSNEVGGILMGEYQSDDEYHIVDCTFQKAKGTVFSFIRLVTEIVNPLKKFFKNTNHNYKKYNYLGEWHSHPSFSLQPSNTDMESMWEIVNDPTTNANFAVLIIFQINHENKNLNGNAMVFLPEHKMIQAELLII